MKKNKHNSLDSFLEDASSPLPNITAKEAAELLLSDDIPEYDKKLISNTVNELFHTAKMLQDIRSIPKITVFGSARTKKDHPDYILCKEFSKQAAELGYMVSTGAGPGIMAAAPEGSSKEKSIGYGIELPFEKGINKHLENSKHVITYRYFFCRKLAFIRDSEAIVLFPGGFGTMDEAFEALTLMHTGRSMPVPFVLMEHEGSNYWGNWIEFVRNTLLEEGMICKNDMYLFRRFHHAEEAIDYINNFYRRYHSLRYTDDDRIVIRLNTPIPNQLLEELAEEYKDFLGKDGIQKTKALEPDKEPELAELPRLIIKPNKALPVDLYCFIRSLNRDVASSSTHRQDRDGNDEITPHKNPRPSKKIDNR